MIRTAALICILISELLLLALLALDINASTLSLVSTLVVVVVTAFAFSALLRNIKSLKLGRNYTLSGIIGVIIGVVYFLWAGDNLESMVHWLKNTGIYFLLLIIGLCSLFLYAKGKKQEGTSLSEKSE